MTDLPKRQKALFDLLFGRGDVSIVDLHAAMTRCEEERSVQDQQRWLGPYITALNRKLADQGLKVEPGALKNTYRLVAAPSS